MRQLGGRLLIEKNEPSGSRFTVEMPILEDNISQPSQT